MEDAIRFRNIMAESGVELTPKRAQQMLQFLEKLQADIGNQSPESVQNLADMSVQERQDLRNQLCEAGTELTPSELEETIEFILCVYDGMR